MPHNPNPISIPLQLRISPDDHFNPQKVKIAGAKPSIEFIAGNPNERSLSIMRLVLFEEQDETTATFEDLADQFKLSGVVPAVSFENERRVLTKIVKFCDRVQQYYMQTYEEDL